MDFILCHAPTFRHGVLSYLRMGCCPAVALRKGRPFKHKALLARLVADCGLPLPVAVEFIENPAGGTYDKQDCERKAFNRIAPKIKKFFPRLPVCLGGESERRKTVFTLSGAGARLWRHS